MPTIGKSNMNFIRISKAHHYIGVSRQTVYAMIRDGRLPAPVALGAGTVGWPEATLREWLASRPTVHWAPKAA